MAVGANILPQKWHAMAARGENDGFGAKNHKFCTNWRLVLNFKWIFFVHEIFGVFSAF